MRKSATDFGDLEDGFGDDAGSSVSNSAVSSFCDDVDSSSDDVDSNSAVSGFCDALNSKKAYTGR